MDLQQTFYAIASVVLGLLAIFIILGIILLLYLRRRLRRMERIAKFVGEEMVGAFSSTRSYSRYLGASIGSTILGYIIRSFRKRR